MAKSTEDLILSSPISQSPKSAVKLTMCQRKVDVDVDVDMLNTVKSVKLALFRTKNRKQENKEKPNRSQPVVIMFTHRISERIGPPIQTCFK